MILRDNLILNEIIVYTSINVCINNYRSAKRLWAPFLFSLLSPRNSGDCRTLSLFSARKKREPKLSLIYTSLSSRFTVMPRSQLFSSLSSCSILSEKLAFKWFVSSSSLANSFINFLYFFLVRSDSSLIK